MNIFKKAYLGWKYDQQQKKEDRVHAQALINRAIDENRQRPVEAVKQGIEMVKYLGFAYMDETGKSSTDTYKYISMAKITFVYFEKGILHIYMERPGVFIGLKGQDIMAVQKGMKIRFPEIQEVKIHEQYNDLERALYFFQKAEQYGY